jgi:hypothetical protein
VGHANFTLDARREPFQQVFEIMTPRRVTAATVTEKQQLFGVGIGLSAVLLPPPGNAVASESAGIVTEAEIEMTEVAFAIVRIRDLLTSPFGLFGIGVSR